MPDEDLSGIVGIGLRIQMIRGKMTQQEFAKKLGIKQCYISRYERGRVPRPEVLLKIARYANVSMEWLLTGKETIYHSDGYGKGEGVEYVPILDKLDRMIIKELSHLSSDDKRILLKVINRMKSG